jgi:hypothetical protein
MEVKIRFKSGVGAMAKTTNPALFGGSSLALLFASDSWLMRRGIGINIFSFAH